MQTDKTLVLPDSHTETRDFSAGSVYFVGTATVILRYGGFTVLTDPNFLHAGAVRAAGLEGRVRYLAHGESYRFEVPESRHRLQ